LCQGREPIRVRPTMDRLNDPQEEAVRHTEGPLVVFAGAGSGKTRVITHRVANLVVEKGVEPWRILAVTFTNKAAGEMRERLLEMMGPPAQSLAVGTFHATCARLLRKYAEPIGIKRDFTIYDDSDQQAMVRRILRDMGLSEKRYAPKRVAGRINQAKQEVRSAAQMEISDAFAEVCQRVYESYETNMKRCGALDFGDLIYRLVVALEESAGFRAELSRRFAYLMVDEFQDTNHVQLRLLRALCDQHQNICVVGDDDQSIYRWRGADRRNILDFRDHFPEARIIKLEQNYRSTQRILRVANSVITRNRDREPKTLWTDNEEGNHVVVLRAEDERDEARLVVRSIHDAIADGTNADEIAIFYRIHAQSRVLEEALRASNVSYRVLGGTRFYDRAEIKDLLGYMRAVHNSDDDISLLRIINRPARGIGKTTIERLMDRAAEQGEGVWKAIDGVAEDSRFGSAARKKLAHFQELMSGLHAMRNEGAQLSEIAEAIVERTGYAQVLRDQDNVEADARLMNLQEFLGSVEEFQQDAETPDLASFLELVTLQTSADEAEGGPRVSLMTVHAAKGLEFPLVIVTGLEEQMFPFRGLDPWEDPDEMEEERRLAYVAFTRARQRLILTLADLRRLFGQTRITQPSRFLDEIPDDDLRWIGGRKRSLFAGSQRGGASQARPPWESIPASPPPGRAPGESYVDVSEGDDFDGEVRKGMRVRHRKFGVGTVQSVIAGDPPRVAVSFPGWGTRKIVASFLEPA